MRKQTLLQQGVPGRIRTENRMAKDNHDRTIVVCQKHPEEHTIQVFKDDKAATRWQARGCGDSVLGEDGEAEPCGSVRNKGVFRYLTTNLW